MIAVWVLSIIAGYIILAGLTGGATCYALRDAKHDYDRNLFSVAAAIVWPIGLPILISCAISVKTYHWLASPSIAKARALKPGEKKP